MKKQTKSVVQKQLRACQREYERIKTRIRKIGFICEGSLMERRMPCGKPSCGCHKDEKKLHGPYYQLSWKEKGKTVSRLLSAEEASRYREWIENRRKLAAIIKDMQIVSGKAQNCILSSENLPMKPAKRRY